LKYRLRVTNTFEKQLKKLAPKGRGRVWRLIGEVQMTPYLYKSLSGQLSSARSARSGDIRLIYTVDENQKFVILLYVGHRERVYE
jgi:mRNA-degrading endonuclease RelE of RelBE toxin-antitoxin system